jgi:cytochrome c peroxidase
MLHLVDKKRKDLFSFVKTLRVLFFLILLWCNIEEKYSHAYTALPEPLSANGCKAERGNWQKNALMRSISKHIGLPLIDHPKDNFPTEAKILLGRKLFFDRRLSINKTMSCAMCHIPEQAFTNWEIQTAVGVEGRGSKRNAPSLLNIGYYDVLFHDGRDTMLETQFIGPLTARNEMANPSAGMIIKLLRELPEYQKYFFNAFESVATLDSVGSALATYQRSLAAGNSPFDQWYYGGKENAVGQSEKRGFEIFKNKADCASCHTFDNKYAFFSDNEFHDIGYGWMREKLRQFPPKKTKISINSSITFQIDQEIINSVGLPIQADLGRYEVTEKPNDRWKYRTSSLRNIAITPPYMHDGGFSTLDEVIDFYNQGGSGHSLQDRRIRPLNLLEQEKIDLKNFLKSLTSSGLNCLIAEARSADPDNQEHK